MNLGVLLTLLKLFEASGLTKRAPPSEVLAERKKFHELGLKIPDK
jgi:hypothetical protein